MGIARVDGSDGFLALPGDDVEITYPSAGKPPKPFSAKFTLVDFYESKMNEYDSELRVRADPQAAGTPRHDRSRPRASPTATRFKSGSSRASIWTRFATCCGTTFRRRCIVISTWRDKQGALLAAVQMETAVLNVLLFMIIAVAGFGILAIFFMIVFEKTRDIGILKSLGATGRGIMGIFLTYGLSLGIVGAGVGMGIGLLFVRYINEIADFLGRHHRPAGVRSVRFTTSKRFRRSSSGSRSRGSSAARCSSPCWPASCRPGGRPDFILWRPSL